MAARLLKDDVALAVAAQVEHRGEPVLIASVGHGVRCGVRGLRAGVACGGVGWRIKWCGASWAA